MLPALTNHSLLSIPTLANEGYTTIFHTGEGGAEVYKANEISFHNTGPSVLQGCHKGKGLWTITSETNTPPKETANNIYNLPSTAKAIFFLHMAAGFPIKAAWLEAIKQGIFKIWPAITVEAVEQHYPESDATTKGHLKKQRQNV